MGKHSVFASKAHKDQFKMLLQIHLVVSLLAVAMGGPGTRPPLRPQPREDESCGNFPSFMGGDRIVGGEAAADPIPWQVAVRQGNWQFCGGSILDETTIMCAAHCFDKGQSMSGYNVRAGVKDKNNNSGQTIDISHGVWNEEMPYVGNNNDFIILKLSSPLTFNENVGPICLPDPDHAPDASGQTCFVSGWGTLESGGSTPSDLQWVAVPTVTNEECSQSYNNGITDSMICAGLPEGGKDSCQGDSGGPFVCRDNEKAVLTGVVSFGQGCALPNYPGVYARVTAVLDWVMENMGENGTSGPAPVCPIECKDDWIGDNYCDDQNNNSECGFDGGDCCQEEPAEGWDEYCSDCSCIEIPETTDGPTEGPTVVPTEGPTEGPTGGPTDGPPEPTGCVDQWIGDSFCDDDNNNFECDFDGGDCCPEEPSDGWDNYCQSCECLEMPETTEGPFEPIEAPSDCIDQWIGDNFCDDQNNNPECEMDGGDCCQEEPVAGWDNYCSDCLCIEIPETTESPFECIEHWIGDNFCDDQNNNPECEFDGGDCCQEEAGDGWDNYCQICECLDMPETTETPFETTQAPSECVDQWIGDNYCDDQNNNPECDFDGGDCCQEDA